ncbi:hypothetical protein RRG08_020294 [Elysia crispata]|uniref:Uncharacterized protein n=1 Tax=Elysia crispata TaxID=231223 RepID=A0AAE1B5M6_9GAST|nr:hypothetical protein RRG08_020294 [Elysia crispata]
MLLKDMKWIKCCSIIGSHFVISPLSFLWSYGNIAPYLDSYYKFYCFDCADGSSEWVLNLFIAATLPGLLLVGRLTRLVDMKWLGLMSTLLCGVALIASAWTLNVSMLGTTVLLGGLNGIAMGIGVNLAMVCVNGWAPEKSSIFTASVTSVPPILAFIQNQIVKAYVNPHNIKPDVHEISKTFFSQPEILEKVPNVILILASIILGTQVIGTALISNPSFPTTEDETCSEDIQDYTPSATEPLTMRGNNANAVKDTHYGSNKEFENKSPLPEILGGNASDASPESISEMRTPPTIQSNGSLHKSCSTSQAVRSAVFWTNSLHLAVVTYGIVLKNGCVKLLGLLFISNDNLLTLLSSLIPLVEVAVRLAFGVLFDKNLLSLKDGLVISLSLNSVLFSFFYFAPQVNFVTYLILIVGLSVSHGLLFLLYTVITLKAFGPQNFAMVYSLGFFVNTGVVLVAGGVFTHILQSLGWFWVFFTCSAPSTAVLLATVFTDVRPHRADDGKQTE